MVVFSFSPPPSGVGRHVGCTTSSMRLLICERLSVRETQMASHEGSVDSLVRPAGDIALHLVGSAIKGQGNTRQCLLYAAYTSGTDEYVD